MVTVHTFPIIIHWFLLKAEGSASLPFGPSRPRRRKLSRVGGPVFCPPEASAEVTSRSLASLTPPHFPHCPATPPDLAALPPGAATTVARRPTHSASSSPGSTAGVATSRLPPAPAAPAATA